MFKIPITPLDAKLEVSGYLTADSFCKGRHFELTIPVTGDGCSKCVNPSLKKQKYSEIKFLHRKQGNPTLLEFLGKPRRGSRAITPITTTDNLS